VQLEAAALELQEVGQAARANFIASESATLVGFITALNPLLGEGLTLWAQCRASTLWADLAEIA
jgi:hypothetical protein